MKDLTSQNHVHIEFEDCRRLWVTVLVAALESYRKAIDREEAKSNFRPGPTSARSRALRWARSRDCKIVMHLAGFEDRGIEPLIRWLDGEGPAPRWVMPERTRA